MENLSISLPLNYKSVHWIFGTDLEQLLNRAIQLKDDIGISSLTTTGELFFKNYVEATISNTRNKLYDEIIMNDILVLLFYDDIDDKPQCQKFLRQIINRFIMSEKEVIITSLHHPTKLQFEDELLSRYMEYADIIEVN